MHSTSTGPVQDLNSGKNPDPTKLYVLIPVFNEVLNIPNLLESMEDLQKRLRGLYELLFIVIDDGSEDGTADAFVDPSGVAPFQLEVLRHVSNRGPGAAFATGFSHLYGKIQDNDWIVSMEGDNTSRHELILQMLTRSREGYDVVLASPYLYGGSIINTSFFRTFLSYGANVFMKEVLELRGLLTMSSFFRLYRGSVILKLQRCYGPGIVERPGFDCMVEMLMKMVFLKTSISEVAMVLDTFRRKGRSKMNVAKTIRDVLTLVTYKSKWKSIAAKSSVEKVDLQPNRIS